MAKTQSIPLEKDPYSLYNPRYVEKYFESYREGFRKARMKAAIWQRTDWDLGYSDPELLERFLQYLYDATTNMISDLGWVFEHLWILQRDSNKTRKQIRELVSAIKTNNIAKRDKILKALNIEYEDVEFVKFFRKQVEDRI